MAIEIYNNYKESSFHQVIDGLFKGLLIGTLAGVTIGLTLKFLIGPIYIF